MRNRLWLGRRGEELARQYLQNKGYSILATHFTCRWGEIDIIASKNGTISFIEVKTRTSSITGQPYESVTPLKIRHLARPIQFYILQNRLYRSKLSLDVISLMVDRDGKLHKLNHFANIDIPFSGFF